MSRRTAVLLAPMLLVAVAAGLVLKTRRPNAPVAGGPAPSQLSPPASASVAEDPTPEVHGRILDSDGKPVEGATVRLVSSGPPYTVAQEATSDPSGLFSFAHVDVASVRVVADHDRDGFVTSAELHVHDRESTAITLVLSTTSGVLGTVVDSQRRPVAGATLSVEGVPWATPTATSDDTGAFHLIVVPDQATSLAAVARGYTTAHVMLAHRDDRTESVVRIELRAASPVQGDVYDVDGEPVRAQIVACAGQPSEARTESAEDGTFEFAASTIGCEAVAMLSGYASSDPAVLVDGRRAALHLKAGGSIEGVVLDDRGSGIGDFTVGIESYSGAKGKSMRTNGPRAFSDVRGSFVWDKLAPGSYVLTASAAGKPPTRSAPIEVKSGIVTRGVRIVLVQGGSVIGRVLDEHHEPLAGADVGFDSVSSVVEGNSAKTDVAGRYRLESAPVGPLTLRVRMTGFRMRFVSGLRVASGGTLTQDVTLVAVDGGGGLELSGIGANIRLTDTGIELAGVGAGEPAARAGLQAGDRIVSIDGETTEGMSVADAVQRLRGEAKTSVGVSVDRPKTGETLDVVIVRTTIVR